MTDTNRGRLLMPHHAATASGRRRAAQILCLLPLLALPACSSSSDDETADPVTSDLRIVVTSASAVRGVQVDLRHDSALTVLGVTTGAAFAGGSCAQNVTDGRVQLGCAAAADVVSPFTAWTLSVRHPSSRDPEDEVTSLDCVVSNAAGSHVAATCTLE